MDRAQQADDLLGVAVPVSVPLSISSNSFDESQFGKKVSVAVLINKSYILRERDFSCFRQELCSLVYRSRIKIAPDSMF